MTLKRDNGRIDWVKAAAMATVISLVGWPVMVWAVKLSAVPAKVDRIEQQMGMVQARLGIEDRSGTNNLAVK